MLSSLPSEVLALVVFHLCQPEPLKATGEDKPVISPGVWAVPPVELLSTCRSVNSAVSPSANPELYARIFRVNFDTAAVHRRLGDHNPTRKIRAREMMAELKRRVRALKRLAGIMERKAVKHVREEDLWVIYVMLVENGESPI